MKFQWYVWFPELNDYSCRFGRRYNLGKPRDVPPNWRARLTVWGLFCPRRGRLCWEQIPFADQWPKEDMARVTNRPRYEFNRIGART